MPRQRGSIILAIALIVVALIIVGVAFDACIDDESEVNDLGAPTLILDHDEDYWDDDGGYYGDGPRRDSGNRGRHRDDNRRAGISPGPFDRSPVDFRNNRVVICFPFSRCDGREETGQEERPA